MHAFHTQYIDPLVCCHVYLSCTHWAVMYGENVWIIQYFAILHVSIYYVFGVVFV
jgi:hypothetical protein